jgi:hypothetical protein
VLDTEQVVYNFKSLLAFWEIYSAYVNEGLELTLRMVSEEGEHRNNAGRRDIECQLVLQNRKLLNVFWQALNEVGAIGMQLFRGLAVFRDSWIRGSLFGERRLGGCRKASVLFSAKHCSGKPLTAAVEAIVRVAEGMTLAALTADEALRALRPTRSEDMTAKAKNLTFGKNSSWSLQATCTNNLTTITCSTHYRTMTGSWMKTLL